MKNKIPIAFSILIGLFTIISCTPSVEKGVVYELSLHQYALKKDSVNLQRQIAGMNLETIPVKLREKITLNENTINAIQKEIILIDPPIPFPPEGPVGPPKGPEPNPCPSGNCPELTGIYSIVLPKDISDFDLVIKNSEGKIVGGIGEATKFVKNPAFLKYPIEVNATGDLIMEISKFSKILDRTISYQVKVNYPKNKKA